MASKQQPAYPEVRKENKRLVRVSGMTLRDYFAAKAMHALINPKGKNFDRLDEVPKYAYEIADAMLKARSA